MSCVLVSEVRLPDVFNHHMVLQRDFPIRIWGSAAPGENVMVKLGTDRTTARADSTGQWQVEMASRPASAQPLVLSVTGATEPAITLQDILIGEVWGQGDFPFLYVQLTAMGTSQGYASHHWPEFRDGQLRCLRTMNTTGMAVTIDVGHPTNVHPTNKRVVGRRLAWYALGEVYDQQGVSLSPLFKSTCPDDDAIEVQFDHIGGGLITSDGKALTGWEIAAGDGPFFSAVATVESDRVRVRSDAVPHPTRVRYAWLPYPVANLINREGLPASPFDSSSSLIPLHQPSAAELDER